MIEPVILKGFRDSLPKEEAPKKMIMRKLEDIFSSYGFVPIDTPALEYTEVLLGKGGGETDKQIFRFKDNGGRDVALRFDLTVPFARFLAAHQSELAIPFKRYHISKVWRGENPQKGRYREFIQCDFDLVGADTAEADFEILSMMHASMKALGVENYTFRVSHRGLFSSFLERIGEKEKQIDILRTVDKLRKIGEEAVSGLLTEITGSEEKAKLVLSYITAGEGKSYEETLETLEALSGGRNEYSERMWKLREYMKACEIEKAFVFDPSITRGLDYYTGIVYETFLDELPSLGSVCSGGRYNDLASLYTKERLPGVGSSIGLDRLLAGLEELKSKVVSAISSADVLILPQNGSETEALKCAKSLRDLGVRTDVYLVKNAKMKKIYSYAQTNSIPWLLTVSGQELSLKQLSTRETRTLSVEEIAREVLG